MAKDELIQNKILSSFRLTKEPSINMKLINKKYIDLKDWLTSNEIYKFIFDNDEKEIKLSFSLYYRKLINIINKSETYEDFLDNVKTNKISLDNCRCLEFIKNNFNQKQLIYKKIKNLDKSNFDMIKYYVREPRIKFKETSVWTLYIGAYFLNGKNDESYNAPIVNIPIKITEIEGGNYLIEKLSKNNYFSANEKLNFALNKFFKLNIPNDHIYDNKTIDSYFNYLKDVVDVKPEFSKIFKRFNSSINEKIIQIEPSAIISMYDPTGGVLMRDYQKISNSGIDPFKTSDIILSTDKYVEYVLSSDNIIEINKPLNIYQKYAISSCLQSNTLIFGPPGTGKSEVIANLIANIINSNKSVLVSSEKAAALEVIENRLGPLKDLCLSAYELNEKDKFYEKIDNIFKKIRDKKQHIELNNACNEYEKIVTYLKRTKILIEDANKNIDEDEIKNNKIIGIETFEYVINNFNYDLIQKFLNIDYFNKIETFAGSNFNQTEKEKFEWLEKFHNLYNKYDFYFKLLSNNSFSGFDISSVNRFFLKYDSKKKDSILKKFLKFKRKSNFLKEGNIELERENWINFLIGIRELKFSSITWTNITEIEYFNFKSFSEYKKIKNCVAFLSSLKNNEYVTFKLLNNILLDYNNRKKEIAKTSAEIIVDNFIYNFLNKFRSYGNNEKAILISKMFSVTKSSNKPEINVFIKDYFSVLKEIFPIWCLSPIQTCTITECKADLFDYGIFDEASQMFVENAIPLVYRCRTNIVAGDDKQLQPTSFFISRDFDDKDYYEDDEPIEASANSLFEQAKASLWNEYYLRNHYRSDNANLISFSNKYLYNNQLQTATKNGCNDLGIEVHTVKGLFENRENILECRYLIEHIINNYTAKDEYENKKILVITFNINQKELIEREFTNNIANKIYLKNAYNKGLIVFRNLENVQGDEADIVYLSITYGKNKDGVIRQMFGPLSTIGGENRLNVAITRAKSKMVVFKSFTGKEINVTANKHTNIFREFILFCDGFENNIINQTYIPTDIQNDISNDQKINTQITKYLMEIKNNDNVTIIQDYKISDKKIDIAFYDYESKRISLGIMIDETYKKCNRQESLEFYDLCKFINDRGYPIYIVNHLDWILKQEQVKEDIKNFVTSKVNNVSQ